MIAYLNKKYGTGSRLFLEVLETFKSNPLSMLHTPDSKVKRLIADTLKNHLKDHDQPFPFKNANLGDVFEVLRAWWEEIRGPNNKQAEVSKKQFLQFALKKRIIIDEKELKNLFKDLTGDSSLADYQIIKHSEFLRVFLRPCFRGALQNVFDFIDKSMIHLKCLPLSLRVLEYQRQLLYAGIVTISQPKKNKRNLDGKIVLKALCDLTQPQGVKFYEMKQQLLQNFSDLQDMTKNPRGAIFHESLLKSSQDVNFTE